MSRKPIPAMQKLTAEIASDEKFAERLAALAGKLRRAKRDNIARSLFTCSRRLRISALNLRGRLAALTPLGRQVVQRSADC